MRSTGPGGQYVNMNPTACRITHIPTGIQVRADDERYQYLNREIAMERLKEQLRKVSWHFTTLSNFSFFCVFSWMMTMKKRNVERCSTNCHRRLLVLIELGLTINGKNWFMMNRQNLKSDKIGKV